MAIDASAAPPPARWSRLDTVALLLVTMVAGVVRLAALGRPSQLVFDEIFYARNACWYVAGSEAVCEVAGLASRSHPPLGNWLIGSGIAAFGFGPFGWRVAVAVAGILSVALIYVLAWRLLRGWTVPAGATVGAIAASALLATDLLHVVHSRVAMIDAFIVLFVIGAVLAAVLDRDRPRQREATPWWLRLTLGRPWRLVAGIFIGAAVAVKWSGAYVAPAVIGLVVIWEVVERRREAPDTGWGSAVGRAFRAEALPTVVLLGLVPLLVYLASYTGRMPGTLVGLPWQDGTVWRGIWEHQRAMLDFHTGLAGDHPYQSPPWSWPLLRRPVAYWFDDGGGTFREILALGNPVTWWPALVALLGLVGTWARSGWRWLRPEPVILGAAAATWLPWLVLAGDRSQTFLWYFLPTLPFLYLALGCVIAWAWTRVAGQVAAGAFALLVLASVVFFAPLAVGAPVDPEAWRMRMLFRDCTRPDGPAQTLPDDTTSEGTPPAGWCWI